MTALKIFFIGIFVASILGGLWWLCIFSGVTTLIIQRSYFVLVAAVMLDMLFATGINSVMYGGFYTLLFIGVTYVAEFMRSRLLWSA